MIREINTDPDWLSKKCKEIHDPGLCREIVEDLIDTANHWKKKPISCCGLAANQIGYSYRVFVFWYSGTWKVVINPELYIVPCGKGPYMREGCLSRPGINPKIQRYKKVKLTYQPDLDTGKTEEKFSGYTARIIQHEFDHLNGIYI